MRGMKLIAQVRLYPTDEQHRYLLQTLEATNALCNHLSDYAWEHKVFGQFALHKAVYHAVRAEFNLSAQVVVRAIGKVADAYKLDKKAKRTFRKHGAIAYDDRILKWYIDQQRVSIWSVGGRLNIPYKAGERQRKLLQSQKGESDLVYSGGKFFLLAVCDLPDPTEQEVEAALGIDMGVTNIAVDSDGEIHTSAVIENKRRKYHRLRRLLQKRKTRASRKKLKRMSGKQMRFQRDVNHCTAKHLVSKAQHTNRAIAIEDLTHIRARTRVRGKEERARRSNWAFAQLRDFLSYKAQLAGVPLRVVDPRYTSQRCAVCGHIEKANRRSQSEFLCLACGHEAHADVNAACNIASEWAALSASLMFRPTG